RNVYRSAYRDLLRRGLECLLSPTKCSVSLRLNPKPWLNENPKERSRKRSANCCTLRQTCAFNSHESATDLPMTKRTAISKAWMPSTDTWSRSIIGSHPRLEA